MDSYEETGVSKEHTEDRVNLKLRTRVIDLKFLKKFFRRIVETIKAKTKFVKNTFFYKN